MFPWRQELSRERRLFVLQRIRLILISGRCSWAQAIPSIDLHASLVAAERRAYDHARTFDSYVCLIFTFASDEARRRLQHQQRQQQMQEREVREVRSDLSSDVSENAQL
uniref:Bm8086 n=1 Tax=Brugia malayi TaxID=6279 RepID=A0A0J9XMD4_BRUMA|nr:Bm8086 [Brugia malayi]